MSNQEKKETPPEEQFIKFPMLAFYQLRTLNESDMKVLLYIQRHTGNFSVARRILSIDEIMHGRKLKGGGRMDEGTGLSNRAIIDAVRKLETARLLFPADEEHGQKSYALVNCPPLTQLMKKVHRPPVRQGRVAVKKVHKPYENSSQVLMKDVHKLYEESTQATPDELRQEAGRRNSTDTLTEQLIDTQTDPIAASSRSPLSLEENEGKETEQEAQPDLVTLRTEYATLSQQLEQLDAKKQTGQWARLYKHVKAAEARLRQAEQQTPPSPTESPEYAKQKEGHSSDEATSPPLAEGTEADERKERLRAIASDLLYWKGGLKVLRQAQLPKWRGSFKWQIEAKIEALQTAYAKLRAEVTDAGGWDSEALPCQ